MSFLPTNFTIKMTDLHEICNDYYVTRVYYICKYSTINNTNIQSVWTCDVEGNVEGIMKFGFMIELSQYIFTDCKKT
jgi:hypothetical protein